MLTDDKRLRTIVQTLAYETHRREQRGQAGLPRGEALTRLEAADLLENVGLAVAFLDYVDHCAGLLVGQGGELPQSMTYNFPHRTFQIARYPTTVVQFQAFVRASEYRRGSADSLCGFANHPVQYVSWH